MIQLWKYIYTKIVFQFSAEMFWTFYEVKYSLSVPIIKKHVSLLQYISDISLQQIIT